ncbi:MAG: DUF4476 domain-containing protein [Crocinitomicaceae bacterium]|nr:DUF4476 domain-containing protein [Crocinitomicaceae bacterium]
MIRTVLLLIFLFLLQTLWAQSRVTISSPDSLAFILTINDQKINNVPCTSITIERISAGKTTISMSCGTDRTLVINQQVMLKDQYHTTLDLRKIKNEFKVAMVSEVSVFFAPVLSTDSLTNRTAAVPVTSEYTGKKGCETPADPIVFKELKSDLKGVHFESQKLKMMIVFCSSHCILTDQLYFLLSKLELEENKMSLLENSHKHIYDLDHIDRLSDLFFLEKNRKRVQELGAK